MDLEGKQIHLKNKTTQKIPNNMFQNFNHFKSIKKNGNPKKKATKITDHDFCTPQPPSFYWAHGPGRRRGVVLVYLAPGPKGSMGLVSLPTFTIKIKLNVGKPTMHGSYGLEKLACWFFPKRRYWYVFDWFCERVFSSSRFPPSFCQCIVSKWFLNPWIQSSHL